MRKAIIGVGLALIASLGSAQSWREAYEMGLTALRAKNWAEARTAFKTSVGMRPEDVSNATMLPGPATERRQWRGGAPYSPNFLAAYSGFKVAQGLTGEEKTKLLTEISAEFEALLAKNQLSTDSFFFLNQSYQMLGDTQKRTELEQKFQASAGKLTWRVDREGMLPEDVAAVAPAPQGQGTGPVVISAPGTGPQPLTPLPGTGPAANPNMPIPAVGRVPALPNKYALIIGNSETKLENGKLPFGSEDVQAIREALVTHAGYDEANIELVINATKDQILAQAKALSERAQMGGTVLIYFTGVGANLDGKDYLAAVDTAIPTDVNSMVAKSELYRMFMAKEARIFAFFQASRPLERGRYFGAEVPMFGRISQMQATLPGGQILSTTRAGKSVGLFTDAFIGALESLRNNQIPITEFGWKVFEQIRGGTGGAGSSQTPTLPVLVQLASDAPF